MLQQTIYSSNLNYEIQLDGGIWGREEGCEWNQVFEGEKRDGRRIYLDVVSRRLEILGTERKVIVENRVDFRREKLDIEAIFIAFCIKCGKYLGYWNRINNLDW